MSVTGAPSGVEYCVKTSITAAGEKWFDGFNPVTGNFIDAKNYVNWPKEHLNFSMIETSNELELINRIALDLGRNVEIPVASWEKAALLKAIVQRRRLKNIIIFALNT